MTHADIFEKFMIEYDKANITSSYPSLTDYEIATILDKAYLALIAQKVTGTNFRRAPFEVDTKAISDIHQLIVRKLLEQVPTNNLSPNEYTFTIPEGFLYFVAGELKINDDLYQLTLIPHQIATNYKVTHNNLPWIESPVTYAEGNKLHILIDPYVYSAGGSFAYVLQYIKEPAKFVNDYQSKNTVFELNDSMAEELINLAIIMSLEIVESTRLDNKIKTAPLES